jgi:hypothetical protein
MKTRTSNHSYHARRAIKVVTRFEYATLLHIVLQIPVILRRLLLCYGIRGGFYNAGKPRWYCAPRAVARWLPLPNTHAGRGVEETDLSRWASTASLNRGLSSF